MKQNTRYLLTAGLAFASGLFGSAFIGSDSLEGRGGEGSITVSEVVQKTDKSPTQEHLSDLPTEAAIHELSESTKGWVASLKACYELSGASRQIDACLSDARHAMASTANGLSLESAQATRIFQTVEQLSSSLVTGSEPTMRTMRQFLDPWLKAQ
ncbi:hypothetical protein [Marinobacter sp. MBR-105]|jgi:hypothetical protein